MAHQLSTPLSHFPFPLLFVCFLSSELVISFARQPEPRERKMGKSELEYGAHNAKIFASPSSSPSIVVNLEQTI